MGRENIDLTFGGVTIGTAVVATLVGGWALDWVGSSIKNAMLLNGMIQAQNKIGMKQANRPATSKRMWKYHASVFTLYVLAFEAFQSLQCRCTLCDIHNRLAVI